MATMKQRRGTASQWTAVNPVLAAGEIGFEIDSNSVKIGNGLTRWGGLDSFVDNNEMGSTYTSNVLTKTLVPDEVSFDAIQAALTTAETTKDTVVVGGEIDTTETLYISSDADLSRLHINYTGTGTAVEARPPIGQSVLRNRVIRFPTVTQKAKPGLGWVGVADSIGIRVNKLYASTVYFRRIQNFGVGLDLYSDGSGCAYNILHLEALTNNKVNQRLMRGPTGGWINQNLFFGGQFAHNSNEGIAVLGTRHILIPKTGSEHPVNMNKWVLPCLEGGPGIVEYAWEWCEAVYNELDQPRIEVNGSVAQGQRDKMPVLWGEGSKFNTVRSGYALQRTLLQEYAPGASSQRIDDQSLIEHSTSSLDPFIRYSNGSSASYPILALYDAGVFSSKTGYNPAADYSFKMSSMISEYKGHTDVFPRLRIDHRNARIYFGNGAVEPSVYLGNLGAARMTVGGTLAFSGEDSDIGYANYRPRDISASRYLKVGSISLRDNGGVLEKSTDEITWTAV